jgi:type II pantothenate kinase
LKVTKNNIFERIGGTNIGGATFLNLSRYMTKTSSFDEMLKKCKDGDNNNVDMLVEDIYGENYKNLNGNLIASSFGNLLNKQHNESDILCSMIKMICYNIAHISVLYAKNNKIKQIIFTGFFIKDHIEIIKELDAGIKYWSKNKIKCLFVHNNGYICSIGSLIS